MKDTFIFVTHSAAAESVRSLSKVTWETLSHSTTRSKQPVLSAGEASRRRPDWCWPARIQMSTAQEA